MNMNKDNVKSNKLTASKNITRMTSMKRPRAPIACYRCHHKKVRCDGVHPNCTRCLSTGVLCAYPSSRRSRNTQPTNVDPFIDNLSQLEARIQKIESDLETQRQLVQSLNQPSLTASIAKTEKELQESRSIVAQLRLRGEQRVARGKRAAAAAEKKTNSHSTVQPKNHKTKKPSSPSLPFYPDFSYYQPDPIFGGFQDWSFENNGFVDPTIIAAAAQQQTPMLSISNYLDSSVEKSSFHLDTSMLIPGLQPSSSTSTTSTTSAHSFGFYHDMFTENDMMIDNSLR